MVINSETKNSFWKLIVDIRDFSYHLTVKQYGIGSAKKGFKDKMWGFLFSYVAGALLCLVQVMAYFDYKPFSTLSLKTTPGYILMLISIPTIWIPTNLIIGYLLRKTEEIPIPSELSRAEYRRKQWVFAIGTIIGILFMWGFSFIFVSYLRHVPIHLWGWAPNEGLPPRTFKDDFGF